MNEQDRTREHLLVEVEELRSRIAELEKADEKEKVEEALLESEGRFKRLFTTMSSGVAVYEAVDNGEDFIFRDFNPSAERIECVRKEDIIGKRVTEVFSGVRDFGIFKVFQRVWRTGKSEVFPQAIYRDERDMCSWRENLVYKLPDGEIVAIYDDVTKRKRAEEALRNNEEKYRSLTENIPGMVYKGRTDWSVEIINNSDRVSGYSVEEFSSKGVNWLDLILAEDRNRISMEGTRLSENASSIVQEYRITAKDGTIHWLSDHKNSLFNDDGSFRGIYGVVFDITERKKAKDALRESERKSQTWLENSPICTKIVDLDFNLQYMSTSGIRDLKIDDITEYYGKPYPFHFHPDSFKTPMIDNLKKAKGTGEIFKQEASLLDIDGNELWYHSTIVPVNDADGQLDYLLVVSLDITERKKMEEERKSMENQLRQSQKLEAMGILAGGVAHEINNPIQGIMSYAELIQDGVDEKELKEFTEEIKTESLRIGSIVKNLLSFARQDTQSHSPARIQDIVGVSQSLLAAVFRKHQIKVETNIPNDLPTVKCRSQQIEQVVINLLTNARDALSKKYESWHEDKLIRISAKTFQKDGVEWVRTTVEDHGTGIPEEIMNRIFDPFFTTKERGKGPASSAAPPGTGLGLSVSHGIITDHHGRLWVESEEGEYTRFHMELSVHVGELEQEIDEDQNKDKQKETQ